MSVSVEDWVEDQRAAGLTINYDSLNREGFPFFLRNSLNGVKISDGDQWRWETPRVIIGIPLGAFDRLTIPQQLSRNFFPSTILANGALMRLRRN